MEGIGEGTAEAEVEVHTGIVAMKSGLTGVIVENMMIEIIIMRVGAGGILQVLAIREVGAGALVAGGIEVQLGIVVKRDVQELSSGTGKRKRRNFLTGPMQILLIITMKATRLDMHQIEMGIMISSHHDKMDMDTNGYILERWCRFSILCYPM